MAGRGRRAVGSLSASRSTWWLTGALLTVVLALGGLVYGLYDYADERRQAQVLASGLEADAAELQFAELVFMSGDRSVKERMEIAAEFADLHAKLRELRALSDVDVVSAIERDLRTVESALVSQLAHLRAGDLEAAEEVRELRTGPGLVALNERAEVAQDRYETYAVRFDQLSGIGLWVAVLTSGVAIGALVWRQERGRIASQAALEQRLQERVAEVAEVTERHRQLEAMKYSFVTAVSHELRTPLTAIHGSLEMLEDGDVGALPTAAARLVLVAARGTRRLSRLVEEIIDLERLESGDFGFHLAPRDLHTLLLNSVESLAPLTERAGVDLLLHEIHADVLCDGDRVLQVLDNLVGNAIKFSSPGGSIHLEAVHRGEQVEVTVRDEGRGIPAEQLGAVFDPFHQVDTEADQAKGGAGLGLTITRHIIESHGGRIWVESEYGTGATFHFTLPLALPEPH